MKIRVDYTITPRKSLTVEPGDFLDADSADDLIVALLELADDAASWSAKIIENDLQALWAEVQKLQAEEK